MTTELRAAQAETGTGVAITITLDTTDRCRNPDHHYDLYVVQRFHMISLDAAMEEYDRAKQRFGETFGVQLRELTADELSHHDQYGD